MQITSKEKFNALSQRGLLGNFLRLWDSVEALDQSGYRGWLTIRSRDKQSPHFVAAAHTVLGRMMLQGDQLVTYPSVDNAVRDLANKGVLDTMYFQEVPAPGAARPIQFEAMQGPQWYGAGAPMDLVYELDNPVALRGIRERGKHVSGLTALTVLRTRLSPTSYDTLQDIWDRFPTAIVEATEFSERVGVFGQRLLVWEVRDF